MSRRTDAELIADITEAINRISSYVDGLNFDDFLSDEKTQDAVVRNIEIIGEASKSISDDLRKKHKNVEWKLMAGSRDRLIHNYFGINLDVVWVIIKEDLPKLLTELKNLERGN